MEYAAIHGKCAHTCSCCADNLPSRGAHDILGLRCHRVLALGLAHWLPGLRILTRWRVVEDAAVTRITAGHRFSRHDDVGPVLAHRDKISVPQDHGVIELMKC